MRGRIDTVRKTAFLLLLLPSFSFAGNLTTWFSDGGYKLAQDDLPPSTTNQFWHGGQAYRKGSRNETVSLVLYLGNPTASDISQVSVSNLSFSGAGGTLSSVVVSSMNVWNMVNRPITQYIVRYLEIKGLSQLSYEWYFDEFHVPERFRRPCTVQETGACTHNSGTKWVDRPDHNKFYPDILEPYENVVTSSFTVYASSSQAIWWDVYIPTTTTAGDYTATITVKEGVTVSTSITVNLHVYGITFTDVPAAKVMIYTEDSNIQTRHHGEEAPNMTAEPYYTTRKKYYQALHKNLINPIGNDNTASDSPYAIDVARLNGSLYSAATGYYGRGQDTGDRVYSIGTYGGGWQSNWGTTNAETVCGHLANWQNYFKTNFSSAISLWYLTDEPTVWTDTNKWSTWASTVTSCQVSGYKTYSFVTGSFPSIYTGAPNVTFPCAWTWLGASSTTWQTRTDYFNGQGMTCGYNGHRPSHGSLATEDDGTSPMAIVLSMYKMGIGLYFYWESTYYNDYQGGRGNTDLWHNAQTFGGAPTYDPDDEYQAGGYMGWNSTNGDGVLFYPGTDTVNPADSRGVDAVYESLRLKKLRDGIQFIDYVTQAAAIDSATVAGIVDTLVPKALYEYTCADPNDCTWELGPIQWSNDPDVWETNKEALAAIIEGAPSPSCGDSSCNGTETCSTCPGDCGECASSETGSAQFKGNFRFMGNGRFR